MGIRYRNVQNEQGDRDRKDAVGERLEPRGLCGVARDLQPEHQAPSPSARVYGERVVSVLDEQHEPRLDDFTRRLTHRRNGNTSRITHRPAVDAGRDRRESYGARTDLVSFAHSLAVTGLEQV